jgi:predicted nucleotidyltransferase
MLVGRHGVLDGEGGSGAPSFGPKGMAAPGRGHATGRAERHLDGIRRLRNMLRYMRKNQATAALFPRIRAGVLAVTLRDPERPWSLSELARQLGTRPSSLQRELARLTAAGILRGFRDGNRALFQADPACPFLPELRGLMAKTAGLVGVLKDVLAPLANRVACAVVYGSVARGGEHSQSDVDLLVIGSVTLAALAPALREAERRLGRNVNPTIYQPSEFAARAASGHYLVRAVLEREKLFVLGTPDDLERVIGAEARRRRAGQR